MALPQLPPATAQEELSDKAKALSGELADVAKQMSKMSAGDAPALDDALRKIAQRADGIGPILSKLFVLDPKGARGLKEQFQSIIDKAAEMAGRVKEKAEEASRAAQVAADKQAKDKDDDRDSTLRGAARGIRNLPTGGVGGAAAGELALAGPEGEVAAAAFSAVTQAVQSATDAISDFVTSSVKAANPALMERYDRSVQDLASVFGQALSPVMEDAIQFTDELNGILSEVAPIIAEISSEIAADMQPVMEAMMELAQALANEFKDLWGEAGDGFKSFAEGMAAEMTMLVKSAEYLILLLGELGKQFTKGATELDFGQADKNAQAKMGKAAEDAKKGTKDKTFAARPASFDSLEGLGQKAQLAAASAGMGAPKSVEGNTERIAEMMANAAGVLKEVMRDLGFMPGMAASLGILAAQVNAGVSVSQIGIRAVRAAADPAGFAMGLANSFATSKAAGG